MDSISGKSVDGRRPRRLDVKDLFLAQQLLDVLGVGGNLANGIAADGQDLGGTNANDSQQLIELIERTINPTVWEVAGGNASMGYFHPSLALVVTADLETHRKVSGMLGALRQAGP